MNIRILLPAALRQISGGPAVLTVRAASVGEALTMACDLHPPLRNALLAETGEIRGHVSVFVNSENIRSLHGLQTFVAEGDTLRIIPSIAGG